MENEESIYWGADDEEECLAAFEDFERQPGALARTARTSPTSPLPPGPGMDENDGCRSGDASSKSSPQGMHVTHPRSGKGSSAANQGAKRPRGRPRTNPPTEQAVKRPVGRPRIHEMPGTVEISFRKNTANASSSSGQWSTQGGQLRILGSNNIGQAVPPTIPSVSGQLPLQTTSNTSSPGPIRVRRIIPDTNPTRTVEAGEDLDEEDAAVFADGLGEPEDDGDEGDEHQGAQVERLKEIRKKSTPKWVMGHFKRAVERYVKSKAPDGLCVLYSQYNTY